MEIIKLLSCSVFTKKLLSMSAECRTQLGYRCLFPFYESGFHTTLHRRCLSGSGGSWCATSYCPGLYNYCSWDYCRIPFCSEGQKIYQVEKYVSNILWIKLFTWFYFKFVLCILPYSLKGCLSGQFRCSDDRCIANNMRCDGTRHCSNDELNCPGK